MKTFTQFISECKLLTIFAVLGSLAVVPGDFCKTPKNQAGECIPLRDCKELFQIMRKYPITPGDISFLQDSTCDVSGTQPKVCCATAKASSNEPSRPPPRQSNLPTLDLASHRNYNLLPKVTECGRSQLTDPNAAQRIIGGQNAGLGSYPWMALLGLASGNEPPQFACGGTLINSRYVLTAAHCVTNLPYGYKLKTVRLGEYDQRNQTDCESTELGRSLCAPPVQDIEVEEVTPHPQYDKRKTRENDIALIRLKQHATLGPYVSPVCLPHGEKLARTGSDNRASVAGWGRLAYDNPNSSPVLQVVQLKLVSMDKCNKFYSQKDNFGDQLDQGRFCAGGDEGTDSCKGDSGGPLMMPLRPKSLGSSIRIFQLGVVSLGPSRCGYAGQPALYTKISHFLKWIYDTIRT